VDQQATTSEADRLLQSARDELDRADSKAATVFAVSGVAVGAGLAAILGRQWRPSMMSWPFEALWWVGSTCLAVGLVALGAGVYPRIERAREESPSLLFGHLHKLTPDLLMIELERSAMDPLGSRIPELLALSRIVQTKYALIRFGMILVGVGLATCISCAAFG
jgi:Family of unknown function (DUF5706)